jgi:hypothetical protein
MIYKFCSLLVFATAFVFQQAGGGWEILARVKFTKKYFKEYDEYFLVPLLDSRIRSYEGEELEFKGYYLPFDLADKKTIIISKFPYSQCFFCGGAGPESVVEVVFPSRPPRLKADQIVTVKGILVLNESDVSHMNFILKDASVVLQ